MMDLGISGFIDKFEQYFGKYLTFVLLLLLGIAIASVCTNIILTFTLKPLFSFIVYAMSTNIFDEEFYLKFAINISNTLIFVVFGVIIVSNIFTFLLNRRIDISISKIGTNIILIERVSEILNECLDAALEKMTSLAETTKSKGVRDDLSKTVADIREKLLAVKTEGK